MKRLRATVAHPKILPFLALPALVVALVGVVATTNPTTEVGTARGDGGVSIEGFKFLPPEITVPAGTEVVWTNQDVANHSIEDGNDLFEESESLATGDAFRFTYDEPGRHPYVCGIHPYMRGEVVVSD